MAKRFLHPLFLNKTTGSPVYPDNEVSQSTAGDHGLSGNYYNWSAAVASNDSTNASSVNYTVSNSICAKGWKMPEIHDYAIINTEYNNNSSTNYDGLVAAPLYLIRAGYVDDGRLKQPGIVGKYWSRKANSGTTAQRLVFDNTEINLYYQSGRNHGSSVRCLAR